MTVGSQSNLGQWCRSAFLLLGALLSACESGTEPPEGGIDLDLIFRPATAAEIAAVEAEWTTRAPRAEGVQDEPPTPILLGSTLGQVRVFSHLVDGNRHYGAVIVPDGAPSGSLPVLVFAHPGDDGVSTVDVVLLLGLLGDRADDFVFVIPSFRSERLVVGTTTYTSGGDPSPWDRDVDDALALLEVTLEEVASADPERIAVLGVSRGGGVGLLMAIRDSRVDMVIEFAGPTDFFGPFSREITEQAMEGELRPLPGIEALNQLFIQPLAAGAITVDDFRLELVRRSPVLFADRLPATQIHHGTEDDVVDVSQAESLIAALDALDREEDLDEGYLYLGAGHSPLQMQAAAPRAITFLDRLLAE